MHLRLNAQLIDTRTDTHVWVEQYDRDLNELFAIQSEIAQKVAERLSAKVTPSEKLAIERRPTGDLVAFELYSHANNIISEIIGASPASTAVDAPGKRKFAELGGAVDLLNGAVARDPSFVEPYCQPSLMTRFIGGSGIIIRRAWLWRKQLFRPHFASVQMLAKHIMHGQCIFIEATATLTAPWLNWR